MEVENPLSTRLNDIPQELLVDIIPIELQSNCVYRALSYAVTGNENIADAFENILRRRIRV